MGWVMRGAVPAAVREEWDATAWAMAQAMSAAVPAFVTRADGTLVAANAQAAPLAGRGEIPAALRALVIDTRLKNCAQASKVALPDTAGGPALFDLVLLPLPVGDMLVLARDVTLEANLVAALVASRDLFRDLALCFTDFAFETDAAGVFSWVSPGEFLGFTTAELHGTRAGEAFGELEPNPFSTCEAVKGREVWVKAKSGAESCIALTASPVFDGQGAWRGVRGVVRDVTALRLFEREAAHAKKREDLIDAVVDAVRAQVEPRRMMLAAADALAAATGSDSVAIRTMGADSVVRVGATDIGLANAIEVVTSYQGKQNGMVRLSREASKGAYGEVERSLVDAILPHLGIAIALAQSLDSGMTSRRDGLTGLLNRRAFLAEVNRKLAAAARAGRGLTLVVFDCDDLKDLNDAFGQATGDELLAIAGRTLTSLCAESDLAGRLDGDEFAVATDAGSNALETGEKLRAALTAAARRLGLCVEISISVGCAVAEPEADETLEDLIGRADCALHAAKREGRNRVVLAEPNQKVTSCSNG